jgi:hypothetical protein
MHRARRSSTAQMMIQLIPNATDIREVFPALIYQALK